MKPWGEIQRTHVSGEEKQRRNERSRRQSYAKADAAVWHFVNAMKARGNPGLERFDEDQRIGVWARKVQTKRREWRLVIERNGRFWLIQWYSPTGGEYPGGWDTRGGRIEKFPQHKIGRAFPILPSKPGKTPLGFKGDAVLESDEAQAFQIALIELIRKYNLPLPPD